MSPGGAPRDQIKPEDLQWGVEDLLEDSGPLTEPVGQTRRRICLRDEPRNVPIGQVDGPAFPATHGRPFSLGPHVNPKTSWTPCKLAHW